MSEISDFIRKSFKEGDDKHTRDFLGGIGERGMTSETQV